MKINRAEPEADATKTRTHAPFQRLYDETKNGIKQQRPPTGLAPKTKTAADFDAEAKTIRTQLPRELRKGGVSATAPVESKKTARAPQTQVPPLVQALRDAALAPEAFERTIKTTRASAHAEAERLVKDRSTDFEIVDVEVKEHSEASLTIAAAISEELMRELPKMPMSTMTPPPIAEVQATHAPTVPVSNEDRATLALKLVERIDVFMRANRPAMSITLNNALGARVEIDRMGPNQVALTLVGHQGPPQPEVVTAIREELQRRGLKLASLILG